MMNLNLMVRTNGFAIFDPGVVEGFFEEDISGKNLLDLFISTDIGDEIVKAGCLVPIINIPKYNYHIIIKDDSEETEKENSVWKENAYFPLLIKNECYIADMGAFMEWGAHGQEVIPVKLAINPGMYAVSVKLYNDRDHFESVADAGYIIELSKRDHLPPLTADINDDMIL
ncbi:hypothetical protein [Acidomonas methanolica]|uniref:hypothetical protein n=1 Tax=Acidomonas methanolica TaxID=437 RepID=UPI002119F258|nr:hypothetical protein [Acidomonas methanolica]MCQ9154965.1 hypothetical protein [Acidomonas methanolica]